MRNSLGSWSLCGLVVLSIVGAPPTGTPQDAGNQSTSDSGASDLADVKRQMEEAERRGDYSAMERFALVGLEAARRQTNAAMEIEFLSALGSVGLQTKEYDKARGLYQQALELCEKLGGEIRIGVTVRNLGLMQYLLGQHEQAEASLLRALSLAEKHSDSTTAALAATNLGNLYYKLARHEKAMEFYVRSIPLAERAKCEDLVDLSNTCIRLGLSHLELKRYAGAIAYSSQGLEIATRGGNTAGITNNLIVLVRAYKFDRDYRHLLESSQRLLQVAEAAANQKLVAHALEHVGAAYGGLGAFDKSLDYYIRALHVCEALGDWKRAAVALINIGDRYRDLGDAAKAIEHSERAVALLEKAGDERFVSQALINLGGHYEVVGRAEDAVLCTRRALALAEKLGDRATQAVCLVNLAGVSPSQVGPEEGIALLNRALVIHQEEVAAQEDIAQTLHIFGLVHVRRRDFVRAEECFREALRLQSKFDRKRHRAEILNSLAAVYRETRRYAESIDCHRRAIRLIEDIQEMAAEAERVGSAASVYYSGYARTLKAQRRPADALVALERGRARGLARRAAQTGVDFSAWLGPDDARRLKEAAALRDAESRQAHTAAATAPERSARGDGKEGTQPEGNGPASTAYDLLRNQLYARYPQFRLVREGRPPDSAQLEQLARRNPDTLFLEWALPPDAKETGLVFALSAREGLRCLSLPASGKQIGQMVQTWRARIAGRRSDEVQAAQALYLAILGPVQKAGLLREDRYSRLVLVADRDLLDVPLGALADRTGKRLIERFALSSAVSLGSLLWPQNPRKPSATLLCAVDPAGSGGERFASALRAGYGPLRFAREEARRVVPLFPGAAGFAGVEAKEARIKNEIGRYAILHFATHGVLVPSDGLRSWLLLAPEPPESAEDGRLEAREIAGLPLSARLAVLSACETGRGQIQGGEGVLGLAWAFRAAGCPSVVASYWKVDDAATGRLMARFYKELKAGKRKDDALRAAMLAVRKEEPDPFYWAGFQLIGESGPITGKIPARRTARNVPARPVRSSPATR